MPPVASLAVDSLRQAAARDFSSAAPDSPDGRQEALVCAVHDAGSGWLFSGMSRGSVAALPLGQLGVHKPRLLGRHGGGVLALALLPGLGGHTVWPALASAAADGCIRLWRHPRACSGGHTCAQVLRGHSGPVTCLAAVHDCMLSGGADGDVLLWRPAAAAGTAGAQQATPQLQLVARLWSGADWVLSLSCQLQPTCAGAGQGVFVALAQQPALLLLHFNRAAAMAAPPATSPSDALQPAHCARAQQFGQPLRDWPAWPACSSSCSSSSSSRTTSARTAGRQQQQYSGEPAALSSLTPMPAAAASSSSSSSNSSSSSPDAVSIFAVKLLAGRELAVLTLSYDGRCRLHSAVDAGLRCCWAPVGGGRFTAADCTGPQGQVLLGDDAGVLHVYSLADEQLAATKQLVPCRISSLVCCCSQADGSSDAGVPACGVPASSSTQFVVLSEAGLGLWQLRQGLAHGVLPGGHTQAVIALQLVAVGGQLGGELASFAAPLAGPESALTVASSCQHQQRCPWPAAARCSPPAGAAAPSSDVLAAGPSAALSAGLGACDFASTAEAAALPGGSPLTLLLSAGQDSRVIVWELQQGGGGDPAVCGSLDACQAAGAELSAMAHLPCTARLATGHADGQVLLWRLDTGSHQLLGSAGQGHINTVAVLAPLLTVKGDELLLSGGDDGRVCLWQPRQLRGTKPHLLTWFTAHGLSSNALLEAHQLVLPGGSSARAGGHARQRRQHGSWSPAGAAAGAAAAGSSTSSALASPAGTLRSAGATALLSAANAAPTALEMLASGGCGCPEVLALLYAPAQDLLVSGGSDGAIRVWAGSCCGELLGQHLGHAGAVTCLARHGALLFSGSDDASVRVWDLLPPSWASAAARVAAAQSPQPGAGIGAAATAAAAAGPPACAAFRVLSGHQGGVTGLAVLPASGALLSCARDGAVVVWDYVNGALLARQHVASAELLFVGEQRAGDGDVRVFAGTSSAQLLLFRLPAEVCESPAAESSVVMAAAL